jgi:hypothetical protein
VVEVVTGVMVPVTDVISVICEIVVTDSVAVNSVNDSKWKKEDEVHKGIVEFSISASVVF